ncbi:SOS response-associated peptidase [Pedobacter sp. Du54]|uniref:SOS response-associated peptidase n=1 Tax=Pedobacter anseongensis TaxID=3133439 RepID=UPI00309ECC5B
MCYHASVKAKGNQIAIKYNAPFPDEAKHQPFYHANGFAHPNMAVLSVDNGKSINLYSWGLIPFWVKTWEDAKKLRNQTLNAKSEEIFAKPSFRDSIMKRRCIVPVTGFFEWKHEGSVKVPHYIHPKESEFFNLAGVYSHWIDPATRDQHTTFSIITTEANTLMADIHNSAKRMPLMIDNNNIDAWLSNDLPKSSIQELMHGCDDSDMAAHQVSNILSSKTVDSNIPEIIEAI